MITTKVGYRCLFILLAAILISNNAVQGEDGPAAKELEDTFGPGDQVQVDPTHVVLQVFKASILSWPKDPEIRKGFKDGLKDGHDLLKHDQERHNGVIVFDSIYDLAPKGYWHRKKVYFVEIEGGYYLVVPEGVCERE